ncbi:MAG: FIG01057804: hypothetical protein [uncultured Thiotrichaceae bacterium]|uniref:DUF3570 domain-containing protein n=1 Tax=uncultured Thiotrichaceae bacterium TaxID=298394 RepID=A0A6S6TP56_9GAMM|nr:MAG: FIG01057804: hypothetical protein [uncultured Thiotrichaceae bacterium]
MQLTQNNRLALAAAGLMAATNAASVSAADWDHEAAVLYYGETDDRVQDGSLKYQGTRTTDSDKKLTINAGIDTLTGASPNGVAPSTTAQTITSPSGNGTITHPAGELPLDDTFKDTRVSLSANWDQPLNADSRSNVGISFSKEYDYLHFGVSGGLSKTLNDKNTTLSVGLAYAADSVEAVGNAPIPFSDGSATKGASSEDKNTLDGMIGLTQVLSKNSLLQLNYSVSVADGYLNDPYKWVSRVDASGTIIENLHESRPDSRTGHNLYAALKHTVSNKHVVTGSARLHTDDWGIDSVTLDTKYRIDLGNKKSIEPHIRYYHQGAADFYTAQLDATAALPANASADYRLAEFAAYTLGATYRWKGNKNRDWRITGEYYTQDPTNVELTPGQASLDANPGFDALMLSAGVKF